MQKKKEQKPKHVQMKRTTAARMNIRIMMVIMMVDGRTDDVVICSCCCWSLSKIVGKELLGDDEEDYGVSERQVQPMNVTCRR